MVRLQLAFWMLILLASSGLAAEDDDTKSQRNETLREELLKMVKEDQDARRMIVKNPSPDESTLRKLADIDGKNTARLKEMVQKHGWPGKKLVGEDGAHAAWLLVQHADKDRAFQKRCLTLLEQAVKANDASGTDLAYLTDRVLVGENKQQVYGTQFRLVDNKWQPFPIEDEKNVDARRKEVGLGTLAEYRKSIEALQKTKK